MWAAKMSSLADRLSSYAAVLTLLLFGVVPVTGAQTQRAGADASRAQQQLQLLQQQVQLLGIERAGLQAENEQLRRQLEQHSAEAAKLKSERAALAQRAQANETSVRELTSNNETTNLSLAHLREQQDELVQKFRQTVQTLANVEAERGRVRAQLADRERELSVCVDTNLRLYDLNREALERLEDRGFFSALGEREPFTKLMRTRFDNLIDDQRYRAAELKLRPPKDKTQLK
jgi:chromosome segregation ATPase